MLSNINKTKTIKQNALLHSAGHVSFCAHLVQVIHATLSLFDTTAEGNKGQTPDTISLS